MSATSHEGLKELSFALAGIAGTEHTKRPTLGAARSVIRPKAIGRSVEITVHKTRKDGREVFQVRGDKPERWVRQTDFANDEAAGYLAGRLNAAGIKDELIKAGAVAGDTIMVGDLDGGVVFNQEPILTTGPELLGSQGTDLRLGQDAHPSRKEYHEMYHQVMGAKTAAHDELWTECQTEYWTDASDQS